MSRETSVFSVFISLLLLFVLVGCEETLKLKKVKPKSPSKRVYTAEENNFIYNFKHINDSIFKAIGAPGGAVVIVKDSSILFLDVFGIKKQGSLSKVNEHTAFRLGSLSKGFTGVLTAKMVEKGLLNWDDLVVNHLPEFKLADPDQTRRVTIAHLLSHSTGLPKHSYTNLIEDGQSIADIIPQLESVNLIAKEGKLFAYQNVTISIIQEIIKAKTDTTFDYWLQKEIMTPLGMTDYSFSKKQFADTDNKAHPHRKRTKTKFRSIRFNGKYYNALAAGGINVSVHDMGKWLNLLLGNKPEIISNESLDYIFNPLMKTSGVHGFDRWLGVGDSYYGMGWRVLDYKGRKIPYHGGTVNEYRTEIVIDRENHIAMAVLINGQCRYASKVTPMFLYLVDELLMKKPIGKE